MQKITPPKPRGRPPVDPVKRALYDAQKAGVPAVVVKPESSETDAQILERVSLRFKLLRETAQASVDGNVRSFIVSGAPGVGKTHTIEEIVAHAKEHKGLNAIIVRGVLTAINLYKLLYKFSSTNSLIVLDDADGIFFSEDATAILKAALDTSLTRQISWMSESSALKDEGIPNTFTFYGSMIFITNIDFQGFIDAGRNKITPHLEALINRSLYLDLKLHTRREIVLWLKHALRKFHILRQAGLNDAQTESVIEYLVTNQDHLRSLSLRTALACAGFIKQDATGWRNMANVFLLK